jgi:DNA-binding XRE family transcriptional regulator
MQQNIATECDSINRYVMVMAKLDIDIEFSKRFRRLIADKGWINLTRKELGKKLGTSSTCATFYMNGNRLPSIDQARTIGKLFDVCVEWLLTGKGPMRPNEVSHEHCMDVSKLTPASKDKAKSYIDFLFNEQATEPVWTGEERRLNNNDVKWDDKNNPYHERGAIE